MAGRAMTAIVAPCAICDERSGEPHVVRFAGDDTWTFACSRTCLLDLFREEVEP